MLISLLFSGIVLAQKILVEDAQGVPASAAARVGSSVTTAEGEYDDFASAVELRSKRRVGAGMVAAGKVGLIGAQVELNYSPLNAAVVSFGGGPRYNSLAFDYKRHFSGRTLSPYVSFGYARWSSTSKDREIRTTTPGFLGNRFLSEEEKASGVFAVDFFTPTLGVQYTQLFGKAVGSSVYAEIVMFLSTKNFEQTPTGALGYLYYF